MIVYSKRKGADAPFAEKPQNKKAETSPWTTYIPVLTKERLEESFAGLVIIGLWVAIGVTLGVAIS